jgi:hypothetical protein
MGTRERRKSSATLARIILPSEKADWNTEPRAFLYHGGLRVFQPDGPQKQKNGSV